MALPKIDRMRSDITCGQYNQSVRTLCQQKKKYSKRSKSSMKKIVVRHNGLGANAVRDDARVRVMCAVLMRGWLNVKPRGARIVLAATSDTTSDMIPKEEKEKKKDATKDRAVAPVKSSRGIPQFCDAQGNVWRAEDVCVGAPNPRPA